MENNHGYKISHIKSIAEVISKVENLDFIDHYIKRKSLCIMYLSDKVFFGWYEDFSITSLNILIDLKSIKLSSVLRLRIFDGNHELYIFRSRGMLRGRYREDDEISAEKDSYAVDARQYLYGTKIKNAGKDSNQFLSDDFITIKESRGIELVIPNKFENLQITSENRIAVKTRNYIDFSKKFQASYTDSRFVDLVSGND